MAVIEHLLPIQPVYRTHGPGVERLEVWCIVHGGHAFPPEAKNTARTWAIKHYGCAGEASRQTRGRGTPPPPKSRRTW